MLKGAEVHEIQGQFYQCISGVTLLHVINFTPSSLERNSWLPD